MATGGNEGSLPKKQGKYKVIPDSLKGEHGPRLVQLRLFAGKVIAAKKERFLHWKWSRELNELIR